MTSRGGIRDRKGAQQHRVEDRKDGGVGADAEGQGEDGDQREARIFDEGAQREADVLQQIFHMHAPFPE